MIASPQFRLLTAEDFSIRRPAWTPEPESDFVMIDVPGLLARRHANGRMVRVELDLTAEDAAARLDVLQLSLRPRMTVSEAVKVCDPVFRWLLWTKVEPCTGGAVKWQRRMLGITPDGLMAEFHFCDEALRHLAVADLPGMVADEPMLHVCKARRPAERERALAALAEDPSPAALRHCFSVSPAQVEWSRALRVSDPSAPVPPAADLIPELPVWDSIEEALENAPDPDLLDAVAALSGWPEDRAWPHQPSIGRAAVCLSRLYREVTKGGGLEQWLIRHLDDGHDAMMAMGLLGATDLQMGMASLAHRAAAAGCDVTTPAGWSVFFRREPFPAEELAALPATESLPSRFRAWSLRELSPPAPTLNPNLTPAPSIPAAPAASTGPDQENPPAPETAPAAFDETDPAGETAFTAAPEPDHEPEVTAETPAAEAAPESFTAEAAPESFTAEAAPDSFTAEAAPESFTAAVSAEAAAELPPESKPESEPGFFSADTETAIASASAADSDSDSWTTPPQSAADAPFIAAAAADEPVEVFTIFKALPVSAPETGADVEPGVPFADEAPAPAAFIADEEPPFAADAEAPFSADEESPFAGLTAPSAESDAAFAEAEAEAESLFAAGSAETFAAAESVPPGEALTETAAAPVAAVFDAEEVPYALPVAFSAPESAAEALPAVVQEMEALTETEPGIEIGIEVLAEASPEVGAEAEADILVETQEAAVPVAEVAAQAVPEPVFAVTAAPAVAPEIEHAARSESAPVAAPAPEVVPAATRPVTLSAPLFAVTAEEAELIARPDGVPALAFEPDSEPALVAPVLTVLAPVPVSAAAAVASAPASVTASPAPALSPLPFRTAAALRPAAPPPVPVPAQELPPLPSIFVAPPAATVAPAPAVSVPVFPVASVLPPVHPASPASATAPAPAKAASVPVTAAVAAAAAAPVAGTGPSVPAAPVFKTAAAPSAAPRLPVPAAPLARGPAAPHALPPAIERFAAAELATGPVPVLTRSTAVPTAAAATGPLALPPVFQVPAATVTTVVQVPVPVVPVVAVPVISALPAPDAVPRISVNVPPVSTAPAPAVALVAPVAAAAVPAVPPVSAAVPPALPLVAPFPSVTPQSSFLAPPDQAPTVPVELPALETEPPVVDLPPVPPLPRLRQMEGLPADPGVPGEPVALDARRGTLGKILAGARPHTHPVRDAAGEEPPAAADADASPPAPPFAEIRAQLHARYDSLDELITDAPLDELLEQAARSGGYQGGAEWSTMPDASRMAACLFELHLACGAGLDEWFETCWLMHGAATLDALRRIGAEDIADRIVRLASLPDREGVRIDRGFSWRNFALDFPFAFPAPAQLEEMRASLAPRYRAYWQDRATSSALPA